MRLSSEDLGLFFEERHVALGERLKEIAPGIEGMRDPAEMAKEMGRLGLYRWLIPGTGQPEFEQATGDRRQATGDRRLGGVDVRALCLVREMLGYVSPLADAVFAVQGLGTFPLLAAGSEGQKTVVGEVERGEIIAGFALTEPDAGSDAGALATTARRDGDGWVLDGEKTYISNAGIATHYLVFATIDRAAGKKGITAFWVPAAAAGLAVRPIALGIDHPIGELTFAGCRVSGDALVGELGGGFALAMRTLDTFRVTVGAAAVGMARRAFDVARQHVTTRVQFGAPLSDTQLVQAHLADMVCDLDAARLLVLRAAHRADHGGPVTVAAAMAKLTATEAAQRIIDRAVQLLGGRGVRQGEVVEALYRAVRPLRIYEGTSEIQRLIIGRAVARGRE